MSPCQTLLRTAIAALSWRDDGPADAASDLAAPCGADVEASKPPAPRNAPDMAVVISSTSILDFVRPMRRTSSSKSLATERPGRLTELLERRPREVSRLLAERQLLRGIPFRVLVRGCGEVFKADEGIAGGASARSYDMSDEMPAESTFQAFVSHSWHSNARLKGISLIHHALFGSGPLLLLTAVAAAIGFLSTGALLLDRHQANCSTSGTTIFCRTADVASLHPLVRQRHRVMFASMVQLVAASLLLLAVLVVATFRPHLRGSRHGRYFLDKCSINQTDPLMKHKGIVHLCEFVQASDKMIVLWDSSYLRRLWCVCELAFFSRISPNLEGLEWCCLWALPSAHALAMLSSLLWFTKPLGQLTGWLDSSHSTELGATWLLLGIVFCTLIWWRRATQHILRDFEAFAVRSAECVSEEDRHQVMELISLVWSKGVGDDGLAAFEAFVRGPLRNAVARKFLNKLPALRCLLGPLVVLQFWLYLAVAVPQQLCITLLPPLTPLR